MVLKAGCTCVLLVICCSAVVLKCQSIGELYSEDGGSLHESRFFALLPWGLELWLPKFHRNTRLFSFTARGW